MVERSAEMERRAALFVTALIALASINNSIAMADNAVEMLSESGVVEPFDDDYAKDYEDIFLQEDGTERQPAEPQKTVVVNVQPGAAKAPEPTIETLTPKHERLLTTTFKTSNGREPDDMEKIEIKRLAVQAAADEINNTQQNKDALDTAKMREQRLIRKIKRDKETIDKVSANEEYAARKAYNAADRKVKWLESKSNRRSFEAEEELAKLNKEKKDTESAFKRRVEAKKEVQVVRQRHIEEQKKVDHAEESVMKAKTILAKAKSTIEDSRGEVQKKTDFLDNIEAHEADARLEYRQAKIQKQFEEEDARKVGLLLKRLTAKKRAVFKFTKNLEKKSSRDFRAAEAGIEKAKADYALAKSNYDKYTKKAGEYEQKLIATQKLVELSKKGVVQGVNMGKDSQAIKSAENYSTLKKKEAKDKTKVDQEDIKAKGQNKMMGAAMAELAKSETLETVARKQKDLVKQHRITMATQVEKIDFLKNEVKKHKEKAEAADKKAKDALHRVKNMRRDATMAREEAIARERYATHIDTPMATRALHKARQIRDRDKFQEKSEADNIEELQQDARNYYLKARRLKKKRNETKEVVTKATDRASHAKAQMQKAESDRDETLAHNKKKIKEINDRLNKAEELFGAAKKKVDAEAAAPAPAPAAAPGSAPAPAPAAPPAERERMSEEDVRLGDSRGRRYERDDDYNPRRARYAYPERRSERGYRRERPRYYRRGPRYHRYYRGHARGHRQLGEASQNDDDRYSAEPALRRHPMELGGGQ